MLTHSVLLSRDGAGDPATAVMEATSLEGTLELLDEDELESTEVDSMVLPRKA